ncbi:MAG TPA: protein kinase [Kofleriaceae bacterium]|nr:protein kinase [Kofleriaceae bacterium]
MSDPSFAQGLLGVTLDGRYRLDAVLGEGGMGSVFRATHLAMDRKVAVKLLKPHLTSDRIALERFSREARATLKVDSPHAVKVLDFGVTPLGDYYMVLEYLDGRTVQRELEIDGPFEPARVAHIARQALHALGAAHAQGLIHRDVKPENLLLMRVGSDGDYTKILDFGVAKLMQGAAGDPGQLALTAAGMVFGTPEFMSPEQACGQPLDGRSDLYSLAATMFVMLTGTTLFEATTAIEWLTHHVRTPPPQLAMVRPELAAYPELDGLIQRCLAKQREQRPETAAEMARLLAELEPVLARSPASAPPRSPSRPGPIHASGFVEVLRDPGSTLLPAVAAPPVAEPVAADAPRPISLRSRRRLAFWLGGAALASVVGVAIGLSVAGPGSPAAHTAEPAARPAPEASPTTAVATPLPIRAEPGTTPAVAVAPTAGGSGTTPAVAAAPRGAAAAPGRPRSATTPPATAAHRAARAGAAPDPEIAEHLREAEDAYRNHLPPLSQLAAADLVLRAQPGHLRARFLAGDALIKSGDIDNGCKYLAMARQLTAARSAARAAGCPGD